jgi:23S rRNA (guanosine2251-2'-O)-methyltransferase
MAGRRPSRAGGKGRPSGGKPFGGKPSGGKPSGGKPSGGRSSGDRTSAGRPAAGGRPVLYGRNAVHEALRARRRRVHRVWATQATARSERWLGGVTVSITDADEIEQRCGTDAHQGVCAETDPYPYAELAPLLAAEAPLLVALDEVQDVQNLGAIARTAECAGATGLILPERRSAEVTPAAAKASAGAVEHLPIARVRNLADALAEAKAAGCWIYGAAGEEGALAWTQPDYSGGVVLVLGAEGRGLRPRVRDTCDALVALPLAGSIGSLNVSAAASALLYEIVRSRSGPTADG